MTCFKRLGTYLDGMKHPLALLIAIGLVLRLIIAPLFTFNIDMGYWAEVIDVFQNGFGLYGTAGYYYTPIWGYYLGFVSGFMQFFGITDYGTYVPELTHLVNYDFKVSAFVTSIQFNFLVKLPLIIIDTITSWLIYDYIMKRTEDRNRALLGFGLWYFSTLVITESTFHGTFDNLSVMLLLAAVMLMIDRKYFFAGAAFSSAVLTKFFPAFMIFFLVAYVLRKEGINSEGVKKVLIAIAGGVTALLLIYLPNISRGDFWQSLYFIAYRVGISRETLASIGPLKSALIVLVLTAIIGAIAFVVWKYGPKFTEKMDSIDEIHRNKKAAKILAISAAVVILLLAVIVLISMFTKSQTFETAGSKGVLLICIFSLFLEMYLAFRLLMLKDVNDDGKVTTILFLSAMAIIIWPCAASYTLIFLPFLCIYASMMNTDFVRPCIIFMLLMTVTEITAYMLSPTSLMYALTGNVIPMVPTFEMLAYPMLFGFDGASVITGAAGVFAYPAMIYISYKWYKRRYKEGSLWQS